MIELILLGIVFFGIYVTARSRTLAFARPRSITDATDRSSRFADSSHTDRIFSKDA